MGAAIGAIRRRKALRARLTVSYNLLVPHDGFVHLHNHSDYSLLDGASKIDAMVEAVKRQGMNALALTDHGNLFGAVEFYKTAVSHGVKPIIGCEAYIAPASRLDRSSQGVRDASYHITLLAATSAGYRNLVKLVSSAHLEGFYYKPRIDKEILAKHAEGLVALSGCLKSEMNQTILRGDVGEAGRIVGEFQQIFGRENFYVEVMDHQIPLQEQCRKAWTELARKTGAPLVATNDCHYIKREDAKAHDALLCIGTGRLVADTDRMKYASAEFYLKSPEEMRKVFFELPEAVKATRAIADRCAVEFDFQTKHLPKFKPEDGSKPKDLLRRLTTEGLARRYGKVEGAVKERMEFELKTIEEMGFVDYFLIVWDFIRYAKQNGIPVGPGRGSAAASIVAYALGITELDPLKYSLIFERFLTPGRVTLPDIDIDFCQLGRDRVIEYVRKKYGEENVAQIITFGTMAARAAIRDVGRVLEVPLAEVDALAKKIPKALNMTIEKALATEKELKEVVNRDPKVKELFDIANRLEGLSRHASTHAAGVVIADKPLTEYLPLARAGEAVTTQFAMTEVEAIGLLKMDFLGLVTLTVMDLAVRLIEKHKKTKIDLNALPLDDPGAYRLLGRGECLGIFQMESEGMRELVQRVKPDKFEDIIAFIALYRPGPLQSGMAEDFVKRKHGEAKVTYVHPMLEPILKDTYGIILYQEQVMQIVNRLAGFSMSEADSLRKSMAKKQRELMAASEQKFVKGAVANGVSEKVAKELFQLMAYFAEYGFNKAHSTAYALIAYQTAWLKANHPTEYMAALMTCEMGNLDKVALYIEECRRLGIRVDPPCVNESLAAFTVVADRHIRFGLAAVKGVGEKAVESIVGARGKGGRFTSLFDFCERVDMRLVNKAVIERLVECGAFAFLGARRSQLAAIVEKAMEAGSSAHADRTSGQATLFGSANGSADVDREALPDIPEWPESQLLSLERKALGLYVTSHPLATHSRILQRFSTTTVAQIGTLPDQTAVVVGGIVTQVKPTVTKKGRNQGEKMAQFVLEDLTGSVSSVLFPREYAKFRALLDSEEPVFAIGTADLRREKPSLKVNMLVPLRKVAEELTAQVLLEFHGPAIDENLLLQVRDILRMHPGDRPVYIRFSTPAGPSEGPSALRVGESFFVSPTPKFCREIEEVLGAEHLVLVPRPVAALVSRERPRYGMAR